MPITLLDIILLGVMLVSAILAMIRGFMREVLSIVSWAAAAAATLYAYPRLLPVAKTYFNNDYVAIAAVVGGVFLLTLIIVSVITVRISDMVLDSRIGALDRTLGFLFGLARGLIIVVVAFLFFDWLVPAKSQPEWVQSAKSKVVLQSTGDWLKSLLPEDPENTILKRFTKPRGDDTQDTPADAPPADAPVPGTPAPGQRSELKGTTGSVTRRSETNGGETVGYERRDRDGLQQLIERKQAAPR